MSLRSFFSALREKWLGRVASSRRQPKPTSRRRCLRLEALETRNLLAAPVVPTIVSVTPVDLSTTGAVNPTLSITFSEAMDPIDLQNTANYALFNSEGQTISVDQATANATNTQVTLSYNLNANLPVNAYTLYIRGDRVHESTDTFTIALPNQLVVANTGTGDVSTLNAGVPIPATGTTPYFYQSVQSYPVWANSGAVPTPVGIVTADFNGDGFLDVAVVNAGSREVNVYSGQANGVYNPTPLRFALPAGSTPVGVVGADLLNNGTTSLAVVDSTGHVDVLLNNSGANVSFRAAVVYAVGVHPVAITAGHFDNGEPFGTDKTDLAVADDSDQGGKHFIDILPGTGGGAFGGAVAVQVGLDASASNPNEGVLFPSAIAAGNLGSGGDGDLAVGGANGVGSVLDASTGPGNFTFITPLTNFGTANLPPPTPVYGNGPVTHVAIARIRAGGGFFGADDVVFTNSTSNIFVASGANGYDSAMTRPAVTRFAANGTPTGLDLVDILGNGVTDILYTTSTADLAVPETNGSAVGVFLNTSGGGGISLAREKDYGVDDGPVALDTGDVDSDGNLDIITANATAPSFTVVRGNGDGTFIQSTSLFSAGDNPTSMAVGDVNGDGIPDIVVADQTTNDVSVFLGDATGKYTLSAASPISTLDANGVGAGPVSVTLADLTGDGRLDIITADSIDNTVSILHNLGNGNFAPAITEKVGVSPTGVVAADFNKDGKIDLAVSHNSAGAVVAARGVTILLNTSGAGVISFAPATEILPDVQATALLAGDFFVDTDNTPSLVVADAGTGNVILMRGNGDGTFTEIGAYLAAPDITAMAAGDLNRDGFLDVVAVSGSTTSTQQITTLLNDEGNGFRPPISTSIPLNVPLNSVALTDITPFNAADSNSPLDYDNYPDLIVGTVGGTVNGIPVPSNIYTLTGNGDGSFRDPVPYEAGGEPDPAVVGVTSDPFVRVVTFQKGGDFVAPNLVRNGNFEQRDLNNEQGNLTGWQTAQVQDSRGAWGVQTGDLSPLSQTPEPAPGPPGKGIFAAMLDQSNLQPITAQGFNDNPTSSYSGSNFLYQDVTLPNAPSIQLSLDLLIDTQGNSFTNPSVEPSLDYRVNANDYQVRIDVLDASDTDITDVATGPGHVLMSIFATNPTTSTFLQQTITANLTALAGKTVRLRIAGVTNIGQLIVGVDNVLITPSYTDVTNPSNTGPQLRNLGFTSNPGSGPVPTTTDPTLIGQVADVGTAVENSGNTVVMNPNNVAFIGFDLTGGHNFFGPNALKTNFFDGNGNFSLTLPNLSFGVHTLGVRVQDKAGNFVDSTFTFDYEGPSTSQWQAVGPGSIDVSTVPGIQFPTVSGRITVTDADPRDPSGNSYVVGTANGGVWKTSDGGNNWTPLTDFVTDANGAPINVPIGGLGLAIDPSTKNEILYAGLGVGDDLPDSQAGFGVLKSINGGASWTLVGATIFANARITKVAIDPDNVSIVYVAVASGGEFGPGVYRTLDGGQNWVDVLSTAATASSQQLVDNMQKNGAFLAPGTPIASVTDLIIDPSNSNDVIVGLGNIGLAPASSTAGVWISSNEGNSWQAMLGGDNPLIGNGTGNNILPSGLTVGRVTIAEGDPRLTGDIATYYVLIGTPPATPAVQGGSVNYGTDFTVAGAITYSGLYKSSDGGKDFTNVMLRQQVTPPPGVAGPLFKDINLLGNDASNAGALAVDPTDPNVVYVGGAVTDYTGPNNLNHGLIRVDTGDMFDIGSPTDTHYLVPTTPPGYPNPGTILNNGDDYEKWVTANNPLPGAFNGKYADGTAYIGEGVAWYDVSMNTSNSQDDRTDNLPADVTSLVFDAQGRLVIGTEQGIYREVYHGTGYDYTSGGQGILTETGANNVSTPISSVQITDINGNLQIADISSVAVDPLVRGQVYTTEWGTGTAVTSSSLNWVTSGLRNPLPNSFAGSAQGGGDGAVVQVAAPDPNAPVGTLATVYNLFTYNLAGTFANYQPESSNQGGALGTFQDLPTAGLSVTDTAGYQPVLALYPQKVFSQGKYQDELLLGTDRIYTTETGSALWDDRVGHAFSPGNYVTAAAFGQALPPNEVIYAATSDGKLFATFNGGADNWPERDTGLPVGTPLNPVTITSIVVDATNSMIAFVTVNGGPAGSGHVFMTINGGQKWTNITGNLPITAAYALAQNPQLQAASGAPNGRLYVGTNNGVYVTVDDVNWTRLGVGLPGVAVTSLDFNQNLEELVAGTDGRGTFMISTNFVGAHVVSITPATPVNPVAGPLTSVTVTFNEPISKFQLSDVDSIIGPNGQAITPLSVTNVSMALPGFVNSQTQWQITFAPQSVDGIYTFTIGPNILDLVGNPMDQNGNQINGENPGDVATFTVVLNSTQDGNFVTGLYNGILGRPADTVGFETVLPPIDAALYSLLPGISTSYLLQLGVPQLISDLYQSSGVTDSTANPASILGVGDLIGQPISNFPGSLSYFESVIQNGGSFEQIIASLVGSIQYFDQNSAGHPINGHDTAFVTQVYQDLLNRAPSSFELNTLFVPQLTTAEYNARVTDARLLLAGTAYQTVVINQDFNTYLHRAPSTGANGELAFYLNQFSTGMTQDQFVADLLGLPEYFNTDAPNLIGAPASNNTWIQAVYQQLFPNYTIHAAEENYWDGLLNSGQLTRTQAAFILVTSNLDRFGDINSNPANYVNGSIDHAYKTLLGRDATPAEITYWEQVYAANPNYRIEDVDSLILGSGEYFAKNTNAALPLHTYGSPLPPSQDQQWADAMYTAMLGATNPPQEQNQDLGFLGNAEFNARQAIGAAVVGSQEYRRDVTDFVYENYLHRAPGAAELSLWLPIVGQGAAPGSVFNGDETLLNAALSSAEYFNLQSDPSDGGLHTDNSWLLSLYTSLRVPVNAAQEAVNLNGLILDYAPTRLAVIQGFLGSAEYQTDFITTEYNTLLGRAPTAFEISLWLGDLQAGATQESVIASIISSPEFFTRAPIILNQSVPATNTTLVEAAYKELFPNYTISSGELNFWLSQLPTGGSAAALQAAALQMATSLDTSTLYYFGASPTTGNYVNGFVNRMYLKFMGRNATQAEINYWMSAFTTTPNLIATILDSTEYFKQTHTFP